MTSKDPWCARARPAWRSLILSSAFIATGGMLCAQDAFEIHVLEYEDLQPGEFTAEVHMNYVGAGTRAADGIAAPTQDQFRLTYELTGAITREASLGVMQLNGKLPGGVLLTAGWRVVPHFYLPKRWHLPLDIGVTAEFSFEKSVWSGNTRSIEILPILEKQFGKWKFDANPTAAKVLRGADLNRGWEFGLAARAGYSTGTRFTPSLEYYSDWGGLPVFLPVRGQVHQIVPGGDFRLSRNVIWNVGVGFGLTPAGDRLFYKTRLEVSFGGKGHS